MTSVPSDPRQAASLPGQTSHADRSADAVKGRGTVLIMAGGTGGHIFPGLAVADQMAERDWRVVWLGNPRGMEAQLIPSRGIAFEPIDFGGLRGKGLLTKLLLPLNLLRGFWQSIRALRRVAPSVVLGMGGYVTFPGGMMAVLLGRPLVLHEQNSIAGLANKVLARVADRVMAAFPGAIAGADVCGNPVSEQMTHEAAPAERFEGRSGPLRLLIVGGSLGARALNEIVPQALALLPPDKRPQVVHQSGRANLEALKQNYAAAGVDADLLPFIDDMATAYAEADLVIARAGAMTVSELACVGAASLLVPYPHAVDDHQTTNAGWLADAGAAWVVQQSELDAQSLANRLAGLDRAQLQKMAGNARRLGRPEAAAHVADTCEALAS